MGGLIRRVSDDMVGGGRERRGSTIRGEKEENERKVEEDKKWGAS